MNDPRRPSRRSTSRTRAGRCPRAGRSSSACRCPRAGAPPPVPPPPEDLPVPERRPGEALEVLRPHLLDERAVRHGDDLPRDEVVRAVDQVFVRVDDEELVRPPEREGVVEAGGGTPP